MQHADLCLRVYIEVLVPVVSSQVRDGVAEPLASHAEVEAGLRCMVEVQEVLVQLA